MTHFQLTLIWEVYVRLGLSPEQAVHLLRRQGLFFAPVKASQQMALARQRNRLRLVPFCNNLPPRVVK